MKFENVSLENYFYFSASIDLDTLKRDNYTATLHIIAKDKGVPTMTSSPLQITVTVVNVNEYRPQFAQETNSVSIPENATVLSEIYRANATDADYGKFGTIVYDIAAGNVDGYFNITSDTGVISIAKELDREATPNGFYLTIEAKGFLAAAPGDTMVLRVNISDINDNSPEFTTSVLAQEVAETANIDDLAIQVAATDSDFGMNADIWFSITGGNTDDLFKISGQTGEIKIKKSLDLEGKNPPQHLSYTLVIQATDGGIPSPRSVTTNVEISIALVNEYTPDFGNVSETIQVMETAAVNSNIYNATATDKDYGTDGNLTYSITSQNPAGYFAIDSLGQIKLTQRLDREVTPGGFNLTIEAKDQPATGASKSSSLQLTVQITDYNDNAPDFADIAPQQVSERALDGDVIVRVEATDADQGLNADISYRITAGNTQDLFEIEGRTGEVKVKRSLDLESNDPPQNLSYTLTITASDGGNPQRSSSKNVHISILPENEFTPVFDSATDGITVRENATVSTEVRFNKMWYSIGWYSILRYL